MIILKIQGKNQNRQNVMFFDASGQGEFSHTVFRLHNIDYGKLFQLEGKNYTLKILVPRKHAYTRFQRKVENVEKMLRKKWYFFGFF